MLRVRAGLLPIVLLVVASSPGILARQPDPTLPDPATLTPAQVQQLFEAMVAMQAQDALRLSEQEYVQFLVRLKTLQATRRRLLQERNKLFAELTRLTNPKLSPSATDAELKERVTAWHELESHTVAEMRKAYNGVDEVLTPHQQARFRVFEEQIERRKLELIAAARQRTRLERQEQIRQQNLKKPPDSSRFQFQLSVHSSRFGYQQCRARESSRSARLCEKL